MCSFSNKMPFLQRHHFPKTLCCFPGIYAPLDVYVNFEMICSLEIIMICVLSCVCRFGGAEGGDGVKSFCTFYSEKLDGWSLTHSVCL